jgi:hypothetical protein
MKSALVILFNQDFSKNIPKLEALYGGRFDEIVYLVPDHASRLHRAYERKDVPARPLLWLDRVWNAFRRLLRRRNAHELHRIAAEEIGKRLIRVHGHQFYFHHFVAQAVGRLLALDVDWYWIVGDDAILHPRFDGAALARHFGLDETDEAPDAVLCTPVVSRQDWLGRIEGSVDAARGRIRRALGDPAPQVRRYGIAVEEGAGDNRDVCVGCADFFGLSRGLLARFASAAERCFDEKLYVEVAVPNIVLAEAMRPRFFSDYLWKRLASPEEGRALVAELGGASTDVFAHPIKLSAIGADQLGQLRGNAV